MESMANEERLWCAMGAVVQQEEANVYMGCRQGMDVKVEVEGRDWTVDG